MDDCASVVAAGTRGLALIHSNEIVSAERKLLHGSFFANLERPIYPRKQPVVLSGEGLLYPETGRSGDGISCLLSGCF